MPTDSRLLTVSTSLGDDAFILTGVTGREELSRPFAFQLEMVAETSTTVAPADIVGKPIGWTVSFPNTVTRQFHGVVRSLTAGEFIGRSRRAYRADVVPWLWFLTRTSDCKIFQNKTAPQIIEDVFQAFGFTSGDAYKLNLTDTYPTREYCVQYRETAIAFVSRLMEEEGIFYTFEYANNKHTMVLADDTSAYADCSPHSQPEYRPELSAPEAVSSWEHRYEFRSGKYSHTDYNFETPATNLLASTPTTVSLPDISKYELFDYPGNHKVTADGTARSVVRIQEAEVGYDVARGAGRCNSFRPGCKFTLQGHLSDKDAFVLTAVEHVATEPLTAGVRGGGGDYSNTFAAIPAASLFRPERLTPRPIVEGPQTAVVVGTSGEEIYTDQYGRIKVHFYWDRVGPKDGTDTCWLRVGELWAGKNWGMIFTPRIGQEVVVDFLEGDPDRPLVTGRVYNADQMPPYALPANMTQSGVKSRSSKGGGTDDFNELRFEDKKDSEQIYFHAQKDFVRVVENDDTLTVGHDQSIEIKNNRQLVVKEGWEKITIEKGDRERTVSQGNDSLTVSTGKRTVEVKSDYSVTVDEGNRSITVSQGNDTHTVTQGNLKVDVTAGQALIQAGQSITLKVGNNTLVIDTTGIKLTVGGSTITLQPAQIAIQSPQVKVSGTSIELAADVLSKVGGAVVQLDGSAVIEMQGGVVEIN